MADSTKLLFSRIAQRIDIETNWQTADPVLLKGEIAITYVPGQEGKSGKAKFKVGDNVSKWSELPYTYDYDEILTQISGLETTINNTIQGLGGNVYEKTTYQALCDVSNPKKGDIGIVKTTINDEDTTNNIAAHYSYTGYAWDTNANSGAGAWVAFDGNYDAENVYFSQDLITTSAVGNISLSNGQATISTTGKNLKQAFEAIFVKEVKTGLQKTPPSLKFGGSNTYVEIGTTVTPSYSTSFGAGEYKYGPATGITASNYSFTNNKNSETRDTANGTFGSYKFTDVSSYTVSGKCTSSQGAIPNSNLGNPVENQRYSENTDLVAVDKDDTSRTYKTLYTSYKPNFYGYTTESNKLVKIDATTVTSDFIRGLAVNQGKTSTPVPSYDVTEKWYQFFYAVPSGRKTSLTAKDGNNVTLGVEKLENITVNHVDDVTSTYTVFFINNAAVYDPTEIQLAWGNN